MSDMKLIKKYRVIVYKSSVLETQKLSEVLIKDMDREPTESDVVSLIFRAGGNIAQIKELYSAERIPFSETSNEPVKASSIDLSNVLFYRLKNPYYQEAIEYEGSIKDPKKTGWYSVVAVVKTAVRNGLDISLWSQSKEISDWANNYLNDYRG